MRLSEVMNAIEKALDDEREEVSASVWTSIEKRVQEALRAQADARPVGEWESVRVKNFMPLMEALDRAEEKGYLPDAMAQEWEAFEFYTHPEASAPGLSEDEWLALAERHIRADWNSEEPDGYLNAVKGLVRDALTRASAATVAEPSECVVSLVSSRACERGTKGCTIYHKEVAQQQAEPVGDERSEQLAVFLNLADVVQQDAKKTSDRYPAQSERADQLAAFMRTACKWAAQSGQRAGVAEDAATGLIAALHALFGADMEYLMRMDGKSDQIEAIENAKEALKKAGAPYA